MSRRWPLFLTVIATVVWVRAALTTGQPLDYRFDAAPAIDALGRLDVSAFLQFRGADGPGVARAARAVRRPRAAATSCGPTASARCPACCRWRSCSTCCCAGSSAGGHPASAGVLIAALFALDPLVSRALAWGHPRRSSARSCACSPCSRPGDGAPVPAAVVLGLAIADQAVGRRGDRADVLAAPAAAAPSPRRGRAGRRADGCRSCSPARQRRPRREGDRRACRRGSRRPTCGGRWRSAASTRPSTASRRDGQRLLAALGLNPVPHALIVVVGLALGLALWARRRARRWTRRSACSRSCSSCAACGPVEQPLLPRALPAGHLRARRRSPPPAGRSLSGAAWPSCGWPSGGCGPPPTGAPTSSSRSTSCGPRRSRRLATSVFAPARLPVRALVVAPGAAPR